MSTQNAVSTEPAPDRIPLSASQAKRLAGLTEMDASNFAGRTIAEIRDKFQWQIDAKVLLFERVCGQVVKTNALSSLGEPVPRATVLLEVAPGLQAKSFAGEIETGAVAWSMTDARGRFRLWVPRFEIEWILRFRNARTMDAAAATVEVPAFFFRVTQDVDSGDTQALICPGTWWDVTRVSGGISDVVLQASLNAVSMEMSDHAKLRDHCAVCSSEGCSD